MGKDTHKVGGQHEKNGNSGFDNQPSIVGGGNAKEALLKASHMAPPGW